MSAIAITPLPLTPLPRTKTEQAALKFLLAEDTASQTDAFNHLLRICLTAKGHLFISERGLSKGWASEEFLYDWLAIRLSRYYQASREEIEDAADRGEFRYLGKQARNAVIDAIRKRQRSTEALDQYRTYDEILDGFPPKILSIDVELGDNDEAWDCLATDEDAGYPCPLGTWPSVEPDELKAGLANEELKAGLGDKLHAALVAVCALFPGGLGQKGNAARAIAALEGVSIQMARRTLRRLQARLAALYWKTTAVRNVYSLLTRPERQTYWLAA